MDIITFFKCRILQRRDVSHAKLSAAEKLQEPNPNLSLLLED